jgi:polyhydroxyalkanoate synthesis regulator protein
MKLIKRYRNRRLYDTELKKTIKMDDIREYVTRDIDFVVVDNASGRDITIAVLSNVITSSAGEFGRSGFKIVNAIMKKGGAGTMDLFKKLALASIGAVNLTREKVEEVFDEMVKRGEMTDDERAEAIKNFVSRSSESASRLKDKADEVATHVSGLFSSKVDEKISELAQKLEKLSARVSNLEQKASG